MFKGGKPMKQSYILLKIILGLVALAHIVIGIIGVIPQIPVSIAVLFYGAALTLNAQIEHVLQMFGAYMLTIGLLGALAVRDPVKNKSIIYGISFLLFLRVLQRLLFAGQAYAVFDISPAYYWAQTALFLVLAVCLILLRPKVK